MAEDEAKLMKRQKEAENRYNEEMAELQQLRDLQVINVICRDIMSASSCLPSAWISILLLQHYVE